MNRSPTILDRRSILSGLSLAAFAAPALAAPPKRMTAYKTPWCGCCGGWIAHMRQAGWTVEVVEREDLAPTRAQHGVPDRLASCHTAVVGPYAIEGHVPAGDVDRLLSERPGARALSAPACRLARRAWKPPGANPIRPS
ncbi:DUF411 domain-containing protein [Brevundimonas aurantiaca]|uniref:DUF411 domain-containing protein n=1 Tax=Brevundimonas aurantiaca TaxID=74316 RepID=UPI00279585F7|nr:DUF411 domain-containing protein [Brevundimonas aurantiaca]